MNDYLSQDGHLVICQNCHTGWRADVLETPTRLQDAGGDEPIPSVMCPDCGGTCADCVGGGHAGRVECSAGCGRYLEADNMESTYCGSICRHCLPAHLARCEICRSDMQ